MGMGLSHEEAKGSIRISLERFSTKEQVDYLIDSLIKAN
jgi:cysteine sulfinate desulfinase/cysteine desulfurase-like protein